jgi:hypothetical protein
MTIHSNLQGTELIFSLCQAIELTMLEPDSVCIETWDHNPALNHWASFSQRSSISVSLCRLKIRIRKAAATFYGPFQTLTLQTGIWRAQRPPCPPRVMSYGPGRCQPPLANLLFRHFSGHFRYMLLAESQTIAANYVQGSRLTRH